MSRDQEPEAAHGPVGDPAFAPTPGRRRLIETSEGSHEDAFGATEWGLLAAVAAIWGSSFLFIEIGLDALSPGVVALARLALGTATLALIPRARRAVARTDLGRVALLGIVWMGVPLILFPVAQQWVASSVAGMLNGAVPLMGALFAAILLRRAPGRSQALGLAIGFAGVVAISVTTADSFDATALGVALLLLAVVLYGLAVNIAVPLQQRYGALPVLLRAQVAALVVVAPYGVYDLPRSGFSWPSAVAMLPLGILGTALAFVAMANLAGRAGAARGAIAIYFVPVVAIVLGVVVRGEAVAPLALIGTTLVLVGAWATSRREDRATASARSASRSA